MTAYSTVDDYIASFPGQVQIKLQELRKVIRQAAPDAEEVISYNMPALRYHGILVYYAAHREHIGFYPADATFSKIFKNDIVGYFTSKGTLRFPFEQPLPHNLVTRITLFRVQGNLLKAEAKAAKKKSGTKK